MLASRNHSTEDETMVTQRASGQADAVLLWCSWSHPGNGLIKSRDVDLVLMTLIIADNVEVG